MPSGLKHLDGHRADVLGSLCEAIVPGSARVEPVVYIDAVLGFMPPPQVDAVRAAIDALEEATSGGPDALRLLALTPEFLTVRALAVEAFYSDFVAPGAPGPGAYEEIDFHSPLALRVRKDWSFLGVEDGRSPSDHARRDVEPPHQDAGLEAPRR
jgi:hypothetical protein